MAETEYRVHINQLRVGVFIRLDLRWFEHPFLFGSFKIKSEDQIQILQQLGISTVLCIPERCDKLPKSSGIPSLIDQPQTGEKPSKEDLFAIKRERIQQLRDQRKRFNACEKRFDETLDRVKNVMKNLGAASEEVIKEADALVGDMVTSFLSQKDVVLHLMNTKAGKEDVFFHSLNTAVLGMLLAKECGLDAEAMKNLGMGLIFHDIGKHRIEKKLLYKQTPLTPPELKVLQLHPKYGEEMVARMKQFPAGATEIILKHHETLDGKGYPEGLSPDQIPLPVRIASIADTYDNHCNKLDPKTSLTPNLALSFMFGKQKEQYDLVVLSRFIRCLGVYPPGSVVQLSNNAVGMVVGVNSKNTLYPSVLLYDKDIPKEAALTINLEEEKDLSIVRSFHPSRLPQPVYDYLSPRTRVTYFVEPSESGKAGG